MTERFHLPDGTPDVEFEKLYAEREQQIRLERIQRRRERAREYIANNPEYAEKARARTREAQAKKRAADPGYQARIKFYEELIAMQGTEHCMICGVGPTRRRLSVDHDHSTDEIRGLLCDSCNRLLGAAKDSVEILQKAIDYLSRPQFTGRMYSDFALIKTDLYPKRRRKAK